MTSREQHDKDLPGETPAGAAPGELSLEQVVILQLSSETAYLLDAVLRLSARVGALETKLDDVKTNQSKP